MLCFCLVLVFRIRFCLGVVVLVLPSIARNVLECRNLALAPKVVGEGGRHSAISGKGERLIRLSRSSQVFRIFSLPILLYLFLASHLFGRVRGDFSYTPVGPTIRPNRGRTRHLSKDWPSHWPVLTRLLTLPLPAAPLSWPWRLCLGRGSGGRPLLFSCSFSSSFSPGLS